eukprot:gnl/MRDRNA2_/MRDRNA2_58452_c0_seq1.p1 gnl/MRDRNA2_/MRDRNA2_58452_c0~~gnl/MRDRNA2_/MRDRNA2_58452_c0_seq1.p1  ORF type:complete len:137 (+),score=26.44 gnl/MRDRNA2_/MRDRNA2_58452_c0_seq1:73-483(+)
MTTAEKSIADIIWRDDGKSWVLVSKRPGEYNMKLKGSKNKDAVLEYDLAGMNATPGSWLCHDDEGESIIFERLTYCSYTDSASDQNVELPYETYGEAGEIIRLTLKHGNDEVDYNIELDEKAHFKSIALEMAIVSS